MKVDLHTHTTASDGVLTPVQLVRAARDAGVTMLAITDHDCMDAYAALPADRELQIVPGVEFSSVWQGSGIHVVGLNLNPNSPPVLQAVARQQQARAARAELMAKALQRLRIPDLLDAARAQADGGVPGRPHFAAVLVAHGKAKNNKQAFSRYLGAGKAADVLTSWASMDTVVGWVRDAGGVAVLAHPAKYGFTRSKLSRVCDAFCAAGGEAMEVISGAQDHALTAQLAQLSVSRGLLASVGSDFHAPGKSWGRLGECAALPAECRPVWERF